MPRYLSGCSALRRLFLDNTNAAGDVVKLFASKVSFDNMREEKKQKKKKKKKKKIEKRAGSLRQFSIRCISLKIKIERTHTHTQSRVFLFCHAPIVRFALTLFCSWS